MELGLNGKAVLVTGGTRGLGSELARWFAMEGARVAICGRDRTRLEEVRSGLAALGTECLAMSADLFEADACRRVVEDAAAAFGALDVLVNNASTDVSKHPNRLEEVTDEQLLERVMGKALAAIRCSRAALPYLRRSGTGRIVMIGGDAARTTLTQFGEGKPGSSYAAGLGNALMVNFAKRLSNEVAKDGIAVNVVHPSGGMKGERFERRLHNRAATRGISLEEAETELASTMPIRRMIDPGDIASLVLFLSSAQAGAITGQSMAVDGGMNPSVNY